ncbi:hypothetical protein SLE2022_392440 [Rubroshorea leprosula]
MEDCMIHQANRYFFRIFELSPSVELCNTGDLTVNSLQFDQIWENLLDGLVRNSAAETSSFKFATGETKLTPFQTINALVQCNPDLSRSDCYTCLRQSVSAYQNCCHGKRGGVVKKPTCFFRLDLYPFYTSLPPPPSSPLVSNSNNTSTAKDKYNYPWGNGFYSYWVEQI